ncbi:MAG: hypothetical protein IJ495_03420 [Bacteroidales bacterium]|nr:hypothetical protein [Bacteroidales bacterium]
MKRYMKIAALAATLFGIVTSCQEPLIDGFDTPAQDGYVNVSFKAAIPDMGEMVTKVVDPDGEDISTMSLLCFNEQGLFLATVQASLTPDQTAQPSIKGSYTAAIPETTDRIHFLANQNMSLFDESEFVGKTESEVISAMEGSSGMMIYWARVAKADVQINGAPAETMQLALQNIVVSKVFYNEDGSESSTKSYDKGTVVLTRNHARVGVTVNATTTGGASVFTVDGFAVVNTSAFGTVAPYSPSGTWEAPQLPKSMRFVTLPENRAVLSDIQDVTVQEWQYVFETENTSENPVSVIIKGKNAGETTSKYYRVMLIDTANDFVPVMRNFNYNVFIMGALEYGQETFEEALNAPATNNVWLSVSDNVKEVRSADYALAVKETYVVVGQNDAVWNTTNHKLTLRYSVEKLGTGAVVAATDKPEVSWLEGNTVAKNAITNTFTTNNTSKVEGVLEIELNQLQASEIKREGTILVKLGPLQRKIKVISINTMEFVPSWVSTEVYSTTAGANMTMMFTIPDNCPAELFPFDVLVSVNDLDVRAASGQSLPIIRKGQDGYDPDGVADTNDNGYKYVYTVTGPGVQRLYFDSILNQSGGTSGNITIEAAHFEPLTKVYTFAAQDRTITLAGLTSYTPDYAANDEPILYMLVPQKVNAPVTFDMTMSPAVEAADEFLLYSSNLDHYVDGEEGLAGVTGNFPCQFYPINEGLWSTGGRVYMFKPRTAGGTQYSVYMHTNKPLSAEVVRISSNQPGSVSGLGGTYSGNTYRSVTFEMANHRPYRFAAQFDGDGSGTARSPEGAYKVNDGTNGTDAPEEVSVVSMTYAPAQKVDLSFDITQFTGTDGSVVHPFGTAFKVFIEAPMLDIDEERRGNLTEEKFYYDESIEKFVYVVDASRETEATFGSGAALTYAAGTGERKTLPFVTNKVVSAGDIVISAEKEKIIYHSKTFRLTNSSISGTIKFGADAASAANVPASGFVPMERISDNTRIGSVSVTSDGHYELRLRGEYGFNWYSDKIQFEYLSGGKTYRVELASLDELFNNPNIVLLPETN